MISVLNRSGPWRLHPSRAAGALALAVVFALGPSPLRAAGPSSQQQLHQILTSQHQRQSNLETASADATTLQARLARLDRGMTREQVRLRLERAHDASKRARLVSAVEADQIRISMAASAILTTRRHRARVHARALVLLVRLRELRTEIARQSAHVRAVVVQLYEMSQTSPLETVLEAKNLTEFMQAQSDAGIVGSRDVAVLEHARRERASVHRAAAIFIREMATLRRLRLEETSRLRAVQSETQNERRLLRRVIRAANGDEERIRRQEAFLDAQAKREEKQLSRASESEAAASFTVRADQRAADQLALEIEEQTGRVPPGVWPGTTPLAAQAAQTATAFLGQVTSPITPTGYWSGYCEGFVQFVYGAAFAAASAITEYRALAQEGEIHPGLPLRGALVFYGGGDGYGHVAIYEGRGEVISTLGYSGDMLPIAENPYLYFPDYLGWAVPF